MNQRLKMLRQLLLAVILIASVGGLSSCEKYTYMPEVIHPVDSVRFGATIQPIFDANCISCHNGAPLPDFREGHSYQTLSKAGLISLPGETSGLYLKMISAGHVSRSSDVDKQYVLIWINEGAHNN
jgi:hypothetical protein